jgi:transposase
MQKLKKTERNKELVELREKGISCQEIANRFNISKQRVTEIYFREKNRGLIKKEKKTKWSSFYPNFIKDYQEGHTIQEVADKYGCSTRTVFVVLKKVGLVGRRRQLLFI